MSGDFYGLKEIPSVIRHEQLVEEDAALIPTVSGPELSYRQQAHACTHYRIIYSITMAVVAPLCQHNTTKNVLLFLTNPFYIHHNSSTIRCDLFTIICLWRYN